MPGWGQWEMWSGRQGTCQVGWEQVHRPTMAAVSPNAKLSGCSSVQPSLWPSPSLGPSQHAVASGPPLPLLAPVTALPTPLAFQ